MFLRKRIFLVSFIFKLIKSEPRLWKYGLKGDLVRFL